MSSTEDLSRKTDEEIEEILERQKKLYSNQNLISTLKDKGLKIKENIKRLEDELEHRKKVDEVTASLASLRSDDRSKSKRPADLDSDDDWPEEKEEEIKEAEEKQEDPDPLQDAFCKQRSQKLQNGTIVTGNPFRLNKAKTSYSEKTNPNWTKPPSDLDPDLSALSPVFSETPAQLLTLSESITIQKNQDKQLKEAETKRSVERLYERFNPTIENLPPETVQQFLFTKADDNEASESDVTEDEDSNTSEAEVWVKAIEDVINDAL